VVLFPTRVKKWRAGVGAQSAPIAGIARDRRDRA
jgi:hypothetical protein